MTEMSAQELPAAPLSQGPRPKRPGTALTPVGVSHDGTRLLLVDDVGAEFTVEIDRRLRAALRGDLEGKAPLGQLEIKMDSTLRPRDIQARIRAGETAEAVALAAGTSVEKIMPFAAPVLAERAHVAERAQKSSIRRAPGEAAGTARTLGEAVAAHLGTLELEPDAVEWDAWRRADGRWTLTATYTTGARSGRGTFTYDPRGSFVVIVDEDGRWLVGDLPPAAPTRNDLAEARARRRPAVDPGETLPLGEDVLDLVNEDPDTARTTDLGPIPGLASEQPLEAFLEEPPAPRTERRSPEPRVPAAEQGGEQPGRPEVAADDLEDPQPPSRRPVRKSRGRASVPSWDEIMFGGGKPE